jgi:hypothetical protein
MSWEAIGIFLIFFVALGGLNLAAITILFKQHEVADRERFEALRREGTDYSHEIEHELSGLKIELPSDYVRREDWIKFGAVIDAKLDTMHRAMESVRERLYGQS